MTQHALDAVLALCPVHDLELRFRVEPEPHWEAWRVRNGTERLFAEGRTPEELLGRLREGLAPMSEDRAAWELDVRTLEP